MQEIFWHFFFFKYYIIYFVVNVKCDSNQGRRKAGTVRDHHAGAKAAREGGKISRCLFLFSHFAKLLSSLARDIIDAVNRF